MDGLLGWFGQGICVFALAAGWLAGCSDDDEAAQPAPATMTVGTLDTPSSGANPAGEPSDATGQSGGAGVEDAPTGVNGIAGSAPVATSGAPAGGAAPGASVDPAVCMASVPAELDPTCAACACEMGPAAISACDVACWELIDCVSTRCAGAEDVECILEACPTALGPAAATATPAGEVLTACGCETDPGGAEGDGAVVEATPSGEQPVDPAACMASLPPELDAACGTCACEADAAALIACQEDCWTLIDCAVTNDCDSDLACLSEFCSESLSTGGPAADPVGMILTQCGC